MIVLPCGLYGAYIAFYDALIAPHEEWEVAGRGGLYLRRKVNKSPTNTKNCPKAPLYTLSGIIIVKMILGSCQRKRKPRIPNAHKKNFATGFIVLVLFCC